MFFSNFTGADVMNPIGNFLVSGKGKNGGWFGWPDDPKMEELRDSFARTIVTGGAEEDRTEIQQEVYDQVIYIPLGQYRVVNAWRKSLSGVLDGPATPVFWNIDKSE